MSEGLQLLLAFLPSQSPNFFPFIPKFLSFCCSKVDCVPDVTNFIVFCQGLYAFYAFYAFYFISKLQHCCCCLMGCLCWPSTQQQLLFLPPALLFLSLAIVITTSLFCCESANAHSCDFLHFISVLSTCHIWFALPFIWLLRLQICIYTCFMWTFLFSPLTAFANAGSFSHALKK